MPGHVPLFEEIFKLAKSFKFLAQGITTECARRMIKEAAVFGVGCFVDSKK